jgi:heme oxygenase (biliverdin-IX-beta and delta-forming)
MGATPCPSWNRVREVLSDLQLAATRNGPPGPAGAMHAFRRATAVDHERLERRLDIEARFASLASYRALLERLHGFYAPVEDRLAPFVDDLAGLDYVGRRKTGLLILDLADVSDGTGRVPRASPGDLLMIESRAQALATLYVLEGATLGGKMIQRYLKSSLGVKSSFFGAYGRDTGARWAGFSTVMEAEDPGVDTAAAQRCFVAMERWLCG